jgi:hypothetical protein
MDDTKESRSWEGGTLVQAAHDLANVVAGFSQIKRFECKVNDNGSNGFSIIATSRMPDWRGKQLRFDGYQRQSGEVSMTVFGGASEAREHINSLAQVDDAVGKVKTADRATKRETSR